MHQLEQALQRSVYQLYSIIYHFPALQKLTASKAHPTETHRNHPIWVANWILFLRRHRLVPSLNALASLVGEPGVTPGPVEMEDPRDTDEPLASW